MALNIISNHSANVAHRNLTKTDMAMSSSLAKLSAGSRVLSAKDDAASLAIGSRITSEVAALKQASVNAGQASSMLQIADGAMGTTQDILTRMKTLAVQGASDNLSSTERSMLDTEYQSLLSEIDRVATDTEFNGTKLVQGSTSVSSATNSVAAAADNYIQAADGVASVEFDSDVGEAAFTVEYDSSTNVLTVTDLTNGTSEGVDIGSTAIGQNSTQEVRFDTVGATVNLNSAFNKSASISADGGSYSATVVGGTILSSSVEITGATGSGAQGLTTNVVNIATAATSAASAVLTSGGYSAAGVDLSSTGVKTATLSDGTNSFNVSFQVTTAFSDTDAGNLDVNGLGAMVFADSATSSSSSFTFKVGTGTTSSEDDLTFAVDSITQNALGVNGTSLTGADTTNSDTALDAINAAIDTLNTSRANIGASQNRLGFASANLATTIENQEASRSTLLDLDVASEMSQFTSKQVLMQAGVSMLAQANQVPQNLMRLFG